MQSTKESIIKNFVDKRPSSVGAYGYGSGVFKQTNYKVHNKPLIDIIFVVENLEEWHRQNMQQNPQDYSLLGRIFLNHNNIQKIKGCNKITYFSNIKENSEKFKYGVIESQDFRSSLETWDSFFIAGRFHKPILEIKSEESLRQNIFLNRQNAFMIACLLSNSITTKDEVLKILCSLSYLGDARMVFAENPRKIDNIVSGNNDQLKEIYNFSENYIAINKNLIYIDHFLIVSRLHELPQSLCEYIKETVEDPFNIPKLQQAILQFLYSKNQVESISQIYEGIKTNGITRSIPYALSKIDKKFRR